MDKLQASQIVFGLCMLDKLSKDVVPANELAAPYHRAIKRIGEYDKVQLMAEFGTDNIRSAEYAAEEIPSDEATKWVDLLHESAVRDEVGRQLERISRKLRAGENGSGDKLLELAAQLDRKTTDVRTMKDVEIPDTLWVPSYLEYIDQHVGGWPASGLTIIAGPAKLGKSTLLLKALANTAREDKYSLFFSLEMKAGMCKARLNSIQPGIRQKDFDKILITDRVMNCHQVYAMASRVAAEYDLHFIGIDYASKMLTGGPSTETMSEVYATMGQLSLVTETPVVLLSGVSRNYKGGEPMVTDIWYSGLAEHEASLILLIYNPDLLEADMGAGAKHTLPYFPGQGYIKVGASRIGTTEGGLGAIRLGWDSKRGRWAERAIEWHGKLIG